MNNPDAIFCSDLHLRENSPECRIDDFLNSQTQKLEFIKKLQEKYKCVVLCSGDVFHHWRPSPWLLSYALRHLPNEMICVPGNHDLPAHNINNVDKSGIQVLADAKKITLITKNNNHVCKFGMSFTVVGFPWGEDLKHFESYNKIKQNKNVALVHKFCYQKQQPFPGADEIGASASNFIKRLSGFDIICVGDNHQTFVYENKNTKLINSGSLMRTTAAQVDHKPCVFLWRASDNEIEQVFLPIDKNAVSRDHINLENEKDERIESFVSRLKDNVEITLSFRSNLDRYTAKNKVRSGVQKIIKECLP